MHWRLEKLATGLKAAAVQRLATRPLRVESTDRYVSFSFDDCPASATTTGRRILEDAGVRGTYYLAGALANGRDYTPYFEPGAVTELLDGGHEIGCHTYDHVPVDRISGRRFEEQIERNRLWLHSLSPEYGLRSFSYPLGGVSVAAKRIAARHYATARSTLAGINAEATDLLLLRANKIYERLENLSELLGLVEHVRTSGGWVIFYTHDIAERPSVYGCSPRTLAAVVETAVRSGAEVLPVTEVLARLHSRDVLEQARPSRDRRQSARGGSATTADEPSGEQQGAEQ